MSSQTSTSERPVHIERSGAVATVTLMRPDAMNALDVATKEALLVAESGIVMSEDVKELADQGAQAYLVGESLMRQDDVAAALRRIRK